MNSLLKYIKQLRKCQQDLNALGKKALLTQLILKSINYLLKKGCVLNAYDGFKSILCIVQ